MDRSGPIGFFDSGLGGISVLRETVRLLPHENYLYFGDSLHAPYGVKPVEEVVELSASAVERLIAEGAKAIVLACNTATSAAAAVLRQRYPQLPIVGTEPALKPAVERYPGGRILVMATAMTLKEQKFLDLWDQFRDQAEILPAPCSGLMEFVERGVLEGDAVEQFLRERLRPFLHTPVDAVVLGCTHYPFLRETIQAVVGRDAALFDSADGVARQLRHRLEALDLLNLQDGPGTVTFQNSLGGPEILALSKRLLLC